MPVDPCECPTCEQATKLLVEVDAALDAYAGKLQ